MESLSVDPCQGTLDVDSSTLTLFQKRGFVTQPHVVSPETCVELHDAISSILKQKYNTGVPPDKAVKKPVDCFQSGKEVLHCINVWKSDSRVQKVVLSPRLGEMVAKLAGWQGARVAEDQLWVKPPGSKPLVFHRDSPYFDFVPSDVVTVWFALEDMNESLGPLQYVHGSHLWQEGLSGAASNFYAKDIYHSLHSTAKANGFSPSDLTISPVMLSMGGVGIHNGLLWHGSQANVSSLPRRGIGIHFVPSAITFRMDRPLMPMWKKYKQENSDVVPDQQFPVTFQQ